MEKFRASDLSSSGAATWSTTPPTCRHSCSQNNLRDELLKLIDLGPRATPTFPIAANGFGIVFGHLPPPTSATRTEIEFKISEAAAMDQLSISSIVDHEEAAIKFTESEKGSKNFSIPFRGSPERPVFNSTRTQNS